MAEDLDSVYHTTPAPPLEGPKTKRLHVFLVVNDLCDGRTEEAYSHIKANNVTSHNISRKTILPGVVIFPRLFLLLSTILYSQFSVVLPLYGPARRHSIMQHVSIE